MVSTLLGLLGRTSFTCRGNGQFGEISFTLYHSSESLMNRIPVFRGNIDGVPDGCVIVENYVAFSVHNLVQKCQIVNGSVVCNSRNITVQTD